MSTRIGLVLLASLLGAGCAVDREVTRANDERALYELWRRFERAFNDGDAETAASVYAPDADRISSSGELVFLPTAFETSQTSAEQITC